MVRQAPRSDLTYSLRYNCRPDAASGSKSIVSLPCPNQHVPLGEAREKLGEEKGNKKKKKNEGVWVHVGDRNE